MLDTNVLISLFLFPNSRMNSMMELIFTKHELVLATFVVDELKAVVRRKFPVGEKAVDQFLLRISYDLVYTPDEVSDTLFSIRDAKDYPVLYTAIIADADILITGDKDFADIEVQKPEILTPSGFMKKYLLPRTKPR